jgi:predicted metal-dependent phosphoesterase TrpH
VEDILRYVAEETDLDLFGITDHDSTDGARAALEVHRSRGYRFDFLPGVEVTNQAGHLLCYFPSGEIHDIPSLRPFWWTVRHAHERGAICVVAHPIYPPWLAGTIERGLAAGERLEGLESINAGLGEKGRSRLEGVAEKLGDSLGLTGNSDAHDQSSIGAAYTDFPGRSLADFLAALESRQTRPVFVRKPSLGLSARVFTTRRSMTRPGWVRNIWREVRGRSRST